MSSGREKHRCKQIDWQTDGHVDTLTSNPCLRLLRVFSVENSLSNFSTCACAFQSVGQIGTQQDRNKLSRKIGKGSEVGGVKRKNRRKFNFKKREISAALIK